MVTAQLASFLVNLKFDDLTKKAVEETKNAIIDTLGICIRGSAYDSSKTLLSCLDTVDIKRESTLWGLKKRASVVEAAFYNSATSHTVEMDDWHREGTVHPGCVVIPATLAVAEEVNATGKDVIVATACGYEVVAKIGMAAQGTQQERGFHPTGTCGVFGATASASKLYKMSEKQVRVAFGIAGSFTGGLLEYQSNGAWTKRLNPANATKAGVFAARLAKAGFFGPETILEGKAGFLQAYSNSFSLDFLKTDTKNGFQIEKVSRKPYPSCRHTHASIDAVFNIKSKNQIDCSKINEIIVESYDRVVEATVKPENRKYRPQTEVDGQFSLPFCLSIALHFGQITPEHFTTPFLSNKSILKTASKVKVRGIKEFNELYPAQNPSRVIIRTDTGEYSDTVYEAKGDPGNPLVSEKIDEKFVMLVSSIFGNDVNYHYLLKQLRQLEEIDTVHDLSYF